MQIQYEVTPLGRGSWRIDEQLNGLHVYAHLVEGSESALLIDTCQGLGDLAATVRQLTQKPVAVVNTHGHLDHIGANYQFDTVYLHKDDLVVAEEHSGYQFRLAMLTRFAQELNLPMEEAELQHYAAMPKTRRFTPIEEGHVFDLGGRRLEVIHTPGHTPGSICLLEAETGWLFVGDTACDQGALLNLPHSCSVECFKGSIQKLRALGSRFSVLHPGHHTAPVGPEVLSRYLACAEGILNGSIQGIPSVSAGEPCLMGIYQGIGLAYSSHNLHS